MRRWFPKAQSPKPKARRAQRVVYHVLPQGDAWAVRRRGATKAAAIREDKPSAVATAKAMAKRIHDRGGRSQIVVHTRTGRIEYENTYGADPRRTRG